MYLCFVDESGTPAKPSDTGKSYFVIAGLIVPEERWLSLRSRLHGLKTHWGYHGELKWRFFAAQNVHESNPMKDWAPKKRMDFRDAVLKMLKSDRSLRVIACVSESSGAYSLPNVNSQDDLYFGTYKPVTERLQYFLQDLERESGRPALGLIVADHRGKHDDTAMRLQHQRLTETDAAYSTSYSRLVEGLFLTPSHLSIGIQLVDMVAGAIWRRYSKGDASAFSMIEPLLRSNKSGEWRGYGVALFPKQGWSGVKV